MSILFKVKLEITKKEGDTIQGAVYKIENMINNKVYVGQSLNIKKRFQQHIYGLNNNSHPNSNLQKDWNKYGEENFKFEELERCKKYLLEVVEGYYINFFDDLYNVQKNNISLRKDNLFDFLLIFYDFLARYRDYRNEVKNFNNLKKKISMKSILEVIDITISDLRILVKLGECTETFKDLFSDESIESSSTICELFNLSIKAHFTQLSRNDLGYIEINN